jgi:hypothetical protein
MVPRPIVSSPPDGAKMLQAVLKAAEPRPTTVDKPHVKNAYAIRFADAMASEIAKDLNVWLKGITASAARTAGSVEGKTKQLDINYSTPKLGLALGVSLKSVHIQDASNGRYTHNMKRNEEELRIEASGYHKRQPYAVMVGVLFLPFDSCTDGKLKNPSSFGSWVKHLRPSTGRIDTKNDIDKLEKIFIGLYELDGSDLKFFDTQCAPPKNQKPSNLMTYSEFLLAVYEAYFDRNSVKFRWADGEDDPLPLEEE